MVQNQEQKNKLFSVSAMCGEGDDCLVILSNHIFDRVAKIGKI